MAYFFENNPWSASISELSSFLSEASSLSPTIVFTVATAIGSIIAVVAVFEIHMLKKAVTNIIDPMIVCNFAPATF
jgi:hypothetical protein